MQIPRVSELTRATAHPALRPDPPSAATVLARRKAADKERTRRGLRPDGGSHARLEAAKSLLCQFGSRPAGFQPPEPSSITPEGPKHNGRAPSQARRAARERHP